MKNEIRLRFRSGDYFVGAEDLHETTWTADPAEATIYASRIDAQRIADEMARTQGIFLTG